MTSMSRRSLLGLLFAAGAAASGVGLTTNALAADVPVRRPDEPASQAKVVEDVESEVQPTQHRHHRRHHHHRRRHHHHRRRRHHHH